MNTIVLLNNIFSADMITDFDYLKKNLDMTKFNIISPLTFMRNGDKYETKDFTVRLMSGAISLSNMYNEFSTISSLVKKDKTIIYYGMTHANVKASQIFVINKAALDTQETLLDLYIKEAGITFKYIKSNQAEKSFKDIQEAVVFFNAL